MSTLAESASIKAMAEKIERLEKELATWQSASHLPSQLGDFARILRSHGIATVFHAGKIEPIDGGTAAESLQAAVEQFGRRERLTPECKTRLIAEISGSLFDATDGFDAAKKAKAA